MHTRTITKPSFVLRQETPNSKRRRRPRVTPKAFFSALIGAFFLIMNGTCYMGGRLVHYCTNRGCCNNYDLKTTINRMVWAVTHIILRIQPCVPSLSKWTKLGPCLDFHLMGMCHSLLEKLFASAFKHVIVKPPSAEGNEELRHDAGFSWEEVAGSRLTRTRALLANEGHKLLITILCGARAVAFLAWVVHGGFVQTAIRHFVATVS